MGLKLTGVEALQVNLINTAELSSAGGREGLKVGAKMIRDLARLYAPVINEDHGLERAIKTDQDLNGEWNKDSRGRIQPFVKVDPDEPSVVKGKECKVGAYADYIHEGIAWSELGDDSKKKQNNTGVEVGKKFLERAMDDLEDDIRTMIESRINQGIGH